MQPVQKSMDGLPLPSSHWRSPGEDEALQRPSSIPTKDIENSPKSTTVAVKLEAGAVLYDLLNVLGGTGWSCTKIPSTAPESTCQRNKSSLAIDLQVSFPVL